MTPMLMLSWTTLSAAAEPPPPASSVRLSAIAPYLSQPGLSAVGAVDLSTWAGRRRPATLSVGPRLAGFGRFGNHVSGLLGGEAGVRWTHPETGRYFSVDGGLAYVLAAQVSTVAVDLGSGDLDRTRQLRHHVLPTLGVHFGRDGGEGPRAFGGVAAGRLWSPQVDGTLWITAEAGVRLGGAR